LGQVESRNGAVRDLLAVARFRSPLIKPDVRISRIRLSDWFHRQTHERDSTRTRRGGTTPNRRSSRFVLRLAIQLDLKFPNVARRCQTHRQSPHLSSFTSTPEVRVLSSASITRPQRSYNPLRLPDWPLVPSDHVWSATSTSPGYPPLAQITFSACRAHYPGGPEQVLVGFFPARAAFPVLQAGRHPHRYFRGLLELHTRYGLHSCSPTIRGLYREAPPVPVSRLGRSQAIKSYQQLLEWVLPPLVIRAFGAH
jgi:hypothetical protein